MTHFLVNKDTVFVKNKFNISEPYNAELIDIEKIDVVFIPLLAFDNKGNRVGYGKGFYDRFLHKCKPDCIFIGVSFFEAENEIDGIALEDFKLNFCVLPTQIISFINQKMI